MKTKDTKNKKSSNSTGQVHWHSLPVDEIYRRLDTSPEGLTDKSAEERSLKYGWNKLPEKSGVNPVMKFLKHFDNLLIYILLIAAVITALMGNWLVTGVIFGVELINAVIGYIQENKAERAIRGISNMLPGHAKVIRSSQTKSILAESLVPGDIVLLKAGDKIPADIRLTEATNMKIEEAVLTGESLPVNKTTEVFPEESLPADRKCMAYSGTLVTNGIGTGIVVCTGVHTQIGQISKMMENVQTLSTPLMRKFDRFGKMLAIAIIFLSAIFFMLGYFIQGYALNELFLIVVGIAVSLIPEGLPVLMTITLAKGVLKMAKQNAIIRKLPSVETLGEVTVICSDKTGTLTKNEMTVTDVLLANKQYTVTGVGYSPVGEIFDNGKKVAMGESDGFDELLQGVALCSNSEANKSGDEWSIIGDPTESALLSLALKGGYYGFKNNKRLDIIPFDSSQKFMAVLIPGEHFNTIYLKGAPEKVLEMSVFHGSIGQSDTNSPEWWKEQLSSLASEGKRIIATASKKVPLDYKNILLSDVFNMDFLGIVAMIDPPRQEAIKAIEQCHQAGVEVKMITGDHTLTAKAIGESLNIVKEDNVISGPELEKLSDIELEAVAKKYQVFARTTPEHKLRLVKALQSNGQIVAMTGDGVNDAPALKRADVGIAMGIKGTDVTKDSAEMILADDNFATIAKAVFEGRSIYDNLKKSILFVLPTNGAEGFVMMASVLIGGHMPITPLQILWINLVTAVTLGFALAFEPGEPNVTTRPPRKPNEPILDGFLIWRIGFVSVLLGSITLMVHHFLIQFGADYGHARSAAVNTLVAGEVFYLLNCRYLREPVLGKGFFSNPKVFYAISSVVLIQLFFTYTPFMNILFDTTPLHTRELTWILAAGLLFFIIVEIEKMITKKIFDNDSEKGGYFNPFKKIVPIRKSENGTMKSLWSNPSRSNFM